MRAGIILELNTADRAWPKFEDISREPIMLGRPLQPESWFQDLSFSEMTGGSSD
jgi:hypothetical protein